MRPKVGSPKNGEISTSKDSIKATEDLALSAFASGLKLAAAFGTVAAKTTSIALASIATGADKFSELVRQEATRSHKVNSHQNSRSPTSAKLTRRTPNPIGARRKRTTRPRLVA